MCRWQYLIFLLWAEMVAAQGMDAALVNVDGMVDFPSSAAAGIPVRVVAEGGSEPAYNPGERAVSFAPTGIKGGFLEVAWGDQAPDLARPEGSLTIAAWIRAGEPPAATARNKQCLAATMNAEGSGGWKFGLAVPGSLFFENARADKPITIRVSRPVMQRGRWYHVAMVWETGNERGLTFYIDGHPVVSMQGERELRGKGTDAIPPGAPILAIGAAPGGGQPFSGELRRLSLWDQALSPTDVFALSQQTP